MIAGSTVFDADLAALDAFEGVIARREQRLIDFLADPVAMEAAIDAGTEVPRMLEASGGGVAVPPDDLESFCTALGGLLADPAATAALADYRAILVGGSRTPTALIERAAQAQVRLMVRVKNALTAAQQAELNKLRVDKE